MFITAICVLFPDLVRIRVIRHRCSVNPPRLCGIAVVWCRRICNPVDPTTWSTLSQPILDDESGFPNRSSASEAYSTKERRPQTPNEKYCEIIYDPILRFYLQIKSSFKFLSQNNNNLAKLPFSQTLSSWDIIQHWYPQENDETWHATLLL